MSGDLSFIESGRGREPVVIPWILLDTADQDITALRLFSGAESVLNLKVFRGSFTLVRDLLVLQDLSFIETA